MMMQSKAGTYILILQSQLNQSIQIGRWGWLDVVPGYYLYVGSAFGSGGVRARVSRHFRLTKKLHWHIDYLRAVLTPAEAWVSYAATRLEHQWAKSLHSSHTMAAVHGFGCSDCSCDSHLFYSPTQPKLARFPTIAAVCQPVAYQKESR